MSNSKSQTPSTASSAVRRTASIDTLPQYTSGDEALLGRCCCSPPAGLVLPSGSPVRASHRSRHDHGSIRGLLGKFKEKMIVSKADLEAEQQQKETKRRELLARYAKRRDEVMAELEKDGGKTKFLGSEYVGPPASPYGGLYRALMPAPGLQQNLAGWLA